MVNALGALTQGTRLVLSKGLRRYVVLPVLVNLALYTGTVVYLLGNFGGWVLLATWLPLANLILLPGAVAGSVLMWQQHYRQLPARVGA